MAEEFAIYECADIVISLSVQPEVAGESHNLFTGLLTAHVKSLAEIGPNWL